MTDPIADFLARIRNAIMARHSEVIAPASKLKQRIAELLVSEGYIAGIDVRDEEGMPNIVVRLRWADPRTNAITGLRRRRAPANACTSVTARSQDPFRARDRHPVHLARADDRSGGAQGRPRRRAPLRGLVRTCHVSEERCCRCPRG